MHFTWISTSYLSYSNLIELQIILAEGLKLTESYLLT